MTPKPRSDAEISGFSGDGAFLPLTVKKARIARKPRPGNLRFIHSGATCLHIGFGRITVASARNLTAALAAMSLMAGSAASAAPRSIDPLVALSVFGTSESRAAVCAAGAAQAAAAAGAAMAQAAGTQPGCVLPVVDAAPPPVVTEPPPPPAAAVAPAAVGGGIGALPLLVGLAAIVAIAAVVLKHNDSDGEINLPISP